MDRQLKNAVLTHFAKIRQEHIVSYPLGDGGAWKCDCGKSGHLDVERQQSGFYTHLDELRLKVLEDMGI